MALFLRVMQWCARILLDTADILERRYHGNCQRDCECLWLDSEGHVARKRAVGRCHLDLAGGCTGGYGGLDFRSRDHGECGHGAVETDTGRACETRSQDDDFCSHFAGGGSRLHESLKTRSQIENGAIAEVRGPVKRSVGALNQPCVKFPSVRTAR